jgi:hypothetical protein
MTVTLPGDVLVIETSSPCWTINGRNYSLPEWKNYVMAFSDETIVAGNVTAGATTTVIPTGLTSYSADEFNGMEVTITQYDPPNEMVQATRNVLDWAADGTLTVDKALPFTPVAGAIVNIRNALGNEKTLLDRVDGNMDSVVAKLPTNYIMGSGVQTDKDDEIDAIKAKTDNLPSDPASETNATANTTTIVTDLDDIKGTGFVKDTHSLTDVISDTGDILADTADMQPKVDSINTNVDQPLSTTESNIRGADSDDLKDISDQIDGLNDFDPATEQVTVQTNNDKTDYTLTSADKNVIADRVWDEPLSGHTGGTTFGGKNQNLVPSENANDYKADVSSLATEANAVSNKNEIIGEIDDNEAKIDVIDGNVDTIVGKMPANYVMGSSTTSDKDDEIDAIKTKTDNLPADPTSEASATTNTASIITEVDANETKIDAIQADLDNPDQFKADVSALATEANATTNTNNIIAEIDVNEGKIDDLDTALTSIDGKIDNVQTDITSIEIKIDTSLDRFARLLGLSHENTYVINNFVDGKHVSSTIELYDSKANAQTHDGVTGLIARYTLSVTYTGVDPRTYLMVKD